MANILNLKEFSTSDALNQILRDAVDKRASDVHFEPQPIGVRLRYRIDGILEDIKNDLNKSFYKNILSRVKLLSKLKIDVISKPQDGKFTFSYDTKREIEVRVSVVPSESGETMVMRILDPSALSFKLEDLGLRADDLEIILREVKKPNGMILNAGPTGSGKTTTLYTFLKKRQNPGIKIITIEDPIEYDLKGIEQTQIDDAGGYTFANGLGSIMRQDPDVILVGEIRDEETAEIAIQAALTGHLVFSTVHANQAVGAIFRLLDLGVKPISVGPALNLIMAQRLARRLCDDCKKPVAVDEILKEKIGKFLEALPKRVNKSEYENFSIYEPLVGRDDCKCGGTGYKGRVGVFELLLIGKDIEELIEKKVGEADLQEFAVKDLPVGGGMVTAQQDGILKVLQGITSFKEVERATGKLII